MKRAEAWGPFIVTEDDDFYFVAVADDPRDWVARFAKSDNFLARAWAERMAGLANSMALDSREVTVAPLFGGDYHPARLGDC